MNKNILIKSKAQAKGNIDLCLEIKLISTEIINFILAATE